MRRSDLGFRGLSLKLASVDICQREPAWHDACTHSLGDYAITDTNGSGSAGAEGISGYKAEVRPCRA